MSEVPKIVHDRLRASLPEGGASAHPDPDQLTAFAEQALSAEERESVLQHLARCGDCREVIALALPSEEVEAVSAVVGEAPATVRTKRENAWFAWPRLRWVALAAGVVVAGAILLTHPGKPSAPSQAKQQPQSTVAEPIGTVAEKPAAPAPANSEVASSKEMYRAQPSRESDRDEALSVANARKAPAPGAPDEGRSRMRAAAGLRADAARGASLGLPQIAQDKLAEKRLAAGLRGTIADMSGAVVPGAQVTIRNMETGDSRTTTTDASGLYAFQNVPAGNSALSVDKPGFKKFDLANLYLGSERMNEINGKLEVGTASETVTVQASAAVIGEVGVSGGKIADKKDRALLARNELAKSAARAAVPPPPPGAHTETVTVEAAAGTVETAQAQTGAGLNGAPPVSKAKQPVQNVDASAPAVNTEESKVAESTISSPVGSLTTSGRNTAALMQLVQLQPLWRNSSGALQRSLDNGANWQTALRADRSLLCNAASANEVWTGGKKGSLFHSSDGGTTWTQVHPTVKGQTLTADVIRIEVRNPAEIVVSTSKREAWTTLDGGKTWEKK
jgi:hypothetical protein